MIAILVLAVAVALALLAAHLFATVKETAAAWRRRFIYAAWLAPVLVTALAVSFDVSVPWPAFLAIAAAAGLLVWVRAGRPATVITRWGRQNLRRKGVASVLDILRVGSAPAMRRKARAVRPSMAALSSREIARVKTTEVAVPLARVGALKVHASLEDVVTIFGGPRTGKTGWMAGRAIDHPGAVVTTSTRTDLMDITRPLRAAHGPVGVFNPGGLGGLPSTIGFPPLLGCKDPVVATERATDMVPESEGDDSRRSFWEGQARRVLAALMHAAALGGGSMRDVQRWVANPKANSQAVAYLLGQSPEPAFETDFEQFHGTNKDTLTSITSSIMPALSWLTSSTAYAATQGPAFDVEALLRDRGTLYLLGRHEAHTAPLLAALVGYIAREARRLAGGKRLDPPPGLFLDEAARVAPVPLPDWSGDFGGSGIFIAAAFQSRADLVDRWGKAGAAKVINNSGARMLFGGTADPEDLSVWTQLAGDRDEEVKTYGKDGRVVSRSTRKTPVLSPAQLANLPDGRVVVFRRGMRPVVGRVQMAWKRRDVRAARRVTHPVGFPVPARVSPALPAAQSPAPAQSPAREVSGVGR